MTVDGFRQSRCEGGTQKQTQLKESAADALEFRQIRVLWFGNDWQRYDGRVEDVRMDDIEEGDREGMCVCPFCLHIMQGRVFYSKIRSTPGWTYIARKVH